MPTPTAVTNAARDADELIRSLSQDQAADAQEQDVETDAPDQTPEPEAQAPADQGVPTEQVTAQEDPAPAEAPAQPQDDSRLEALEKQAQLWEQRYRSLNGMIESRDRQIESLHHLLANLQETQKAAQQQPEEPTPSVTKEDVEAFGDDMIDLAKRIAQAEIKQRERAFEQRIQELESKLTGVSQQAASSAQDQFLASLRSRVPNLDQINQDSAFIAWLSQSPARQKTFNEAVQSLDVEGAAWFFETWASANAQPQPQRPAQAAQAPAQQPSQQTDQRLQRQVAPGKSRSTPTPAQRSEGAKRQWTRSAIVEFYKNLASYPQQDRDRIERDIALAQKEGRVDFTK